MSTLELQNQNIELAKEVARVTKIKYQEGIGTSLEVTTAETSLIEAQTNYYNALYDALVAKVDYEKANGKFIINESNLDLVKPDSRIMHPLPHMEELSLSHEIESNDPRVAYFRQAENGLYIRMALLNWLMNGKNHTT